MLERQAKTIETLANLCIVIVALLGAAVLARQLIAREPVPAAASTARPRPSGQAAGAAAPVKGAPFSLPGVDWTKQDQTLVLVLSSTCHFCTESAPFYQRLVTEARRNRNTRLIAVLPQPTEDGIRYLKQVGVSIDEVLQAPLSTLGTRGTPTLILVDKRGEVKNTWIGRLAAERESEVLAVF